MTKIIIFGNSGSGKSTLASHISKLNASAHLDLDTIAWLPTNPPHRMPIAQSNQHILQFTNDNQNWVIEGCYSDLIEIALPSASEIIFLNLPVDICIENAKSRPWEPHKYSSKKDQDANLGMLIDWITQYENRSDTFSKQAHLALFDQFQGKKRMCTVNNEYTHKIVNMHVHLLEEESTDYSSVLETLLQLRTDYNLKSLREQIQKQQLTGYKVAYVKSSNNILAAAGFSMGEKLAWGKHIYIEDLVTNSHFRSNGVGKFFMDWFTLFALKNDCKQIHLDSGVQRFSAHKFYLREGFNIASHHFSKIGVQAL